MAERRRRQPTRDVLAWARTVPITVSAFRLDLSRAAVRHTATNYDALVAVIRAAGASLADEREAYWIVRNRVHALLGAHRRSMGAADWPPDPKDRHEEVTVVDSSPALAGGRLLLQRAWCVSCADCHAQPEPPIVGGTYAQAERTLRAYGWRRRLGRWLCDTCQGYNASNEGGSL